MSDKMECRNCKVRLTELEGKVGYECLKCGLLAMTDGYVVYDPKEPKWKTVSAE
jgi:hypothetical protein